MSHHVHIAYGFHVNCYHSYRGDSNDDAGFGADIRIIRKIIAILNALNARGIPVKGTWDFENGYSLEDILPRYAPDIIEGVKERCQRFGDENILMGYNNGALGAMTPDEFDASIQWAITNEKGSGLQDIFGAFEPIVRPQEVMFTPSQVHDYKRNGMKAVCLYYSCVPFDAFRTITPQLPDALAFYPLNYSHEGERLTVIPTYSNADVMDAGTLRALAKDLHAKQCSGEINNDVFLFINMDADAILWEPMGLPFPLNRMANTQGILGLVEEVADLPFVVFDTPGGFLRSHAPMGEIAFGHDTADGSFTGYSSWSEKPFNRLIWTRLERARAMALAQGQDAGSAAFRERILLLSTTHFGLASPVLNMDRERRALALSEEMLRKEMAAFPPAEELTLLLPQASKCTSAELCFAPGWLPQIEQLQLSAEQLQHVGAVALQWHEDGSVASAFVLLCFEEEVTRSTLHAACGPAREATAQAVNADAPYCLSAEQLMLQFCPHGELLRATHGGKAIGGPDFLRSFLTYENRNYPMTAKRCEMLPAAGEARGLRVTGELHLPGELRPGHGSFDFFTMPGFGGILLRMNVRYPYTAEQDAMSTVSSVLGRRHDRRWQQTAPVQLTPKLPGELHVIKRNFAGAITQYPIAGFRESVPENTELDSFNHQLSGGFVALSNGETGLLLANARQILGSMAHCPMRLRRSGGQDTVKLNPFGTYHGKQRKHPSRGNGSVGEAFVMVAPQSRSLAPAYNGAEETALLALFAYEGMVPEEPMLQQVCAFADGATLLSPPASPLRGPGETEDQLRFPDPLECSGLTGKQHLTILSGMRSGRMRMVSVGARAFGSMIRAQWKARK